MLNLPGKPKKGWKLGRDSFSKLIVYFKDGNNRTLYSLDWRHKYSKARDKQLGLGRLRKKVMDYGAQAGVAIIYDKVTGEIIDKFFEGKNCKG